MSKRAGTKRNFLLMALLIVALFGAAVYANIWKESRRVAEVVVEGNRIIPAKDILALAKVSNNSLLVDLDLFAIEQRVLKNEFVKFVAVHRDIPNRVRISIEERIPVAAMVHDPVGVMDKVYYLDAEGYVLPPVRSPFIFDLPVLSGTLPLGELVTGKQTKNKNVQDALYILSVAKEVGDEVYRNISEIRVHDGKDFFFYTAEFGIPVLLGKGEVGPKLVKFDAFWKNIVARNGAHELQYIDLRFEEQVVVRYSILSGATYGLVEKNLTSSSVEKRL